MVDVFSGQSFAIFDVFQAIWELLGLVWTLVVIVSTCLVVFLYLYQLRPRHEAPKVLCSYIDFSSGESVEEKEFVLHWGHWIHHRIKLPPIPRHGTWRLFYKPSISFKQAIPSSCYEEFAKEESRIIVLTDKTQFEEAEVDSVCLETSIKQNDGSYRDNIKFEIIDSGIVVKNFNYVEIRNYRLKLPANIGIEKLPLATLAQVLVPEPPPTGLGTDGITITIRLLRPAQGGKPGTIFIPIQ